mmetsp:Transcript_25540/g.51584  ORF Transcript_25540/g.51584 Transcript_25540/m.51584 type:complete len:190 (-) Transcript_25540:18-587(-)|eukprot:CAMPEP_0113818244 /NCGR_PEP_ID=MMETSP0328-20130328/143_1 /TAXON_ID=39455 /ORGANISM="Alexandrium minutum" /LENGTH=189 /DNA_ID=CAMNT_0000786179 /DNA_START=113 /DNA_END=682 /DNA_ORIENTATION=- /assembly_acc=CAM_ASM_000350
MTSPQALAGVGFAGVGLGAGVKTPGQGPNDSRSTSAAGVDDSALKTRIAKCNCGQLRVTVTGPDPARISLCHCNLCQKQSGSVFAVQARFPKEQVTIEGESTAWKIPKDEADQVGYHNCVSLGGGASFHFCPTCGSTVWYSADADPARIGVKVGCFTDPLFPPPKLSGFEGYMHPWAMDTASLQVEHLK